MVLPLYLQVTLESLSEGTSGLINSDWHVLKFNGYMVEQTMEPKGTFVTYYSLS